MASRNFLVSDKMQFPNGATVSGGGGEIHQPGPWFPDERDGFISWLRAEFAAANAIIDSLCHHLRGVGEPGEYDLVVGRVQQRRVAWNPVLHMQQFFPISDVMLALQQVAWRRQQRVVDQARVGGKEFKRPDGHIFGCKYGQMADDTKENHNLSLNSSNLSANASVTGIKEKKETVTEREEVKFGHDVRKFDDNGLSDAQKLTVEAGSCNLIVGKNSVSDAIQNEKEESLIISPKTFSTRETYDGKPVNIAEGLNLYEKLLDEEVSKLISLVYDLRATGKRGKLPGPTFVVSKRPYRGHGREMIQLGVAIPDWSSDDNPAEDWRVEPIPDLLQNLIDRLVNMQLTPTKPDTCIIDIYNEGDYSQPHSFPLWCGRPICLLSLTECDIVFGAAIESNHPGIYRGSLNLTLSPGSLLVMQGNSTDIAKRAIPSIRKHRILVTFLKSKTSKACQGDGQRLHLQASNWGPPPPSRPPKHYTAPPTTGLMLAPPIRAQLPPNGAPPSFVPPPVPTPMAFPASMPLPTGWHPPPRLPIPGTGVFLPAETKIAAAAEMSSTPKTTLQVETENDDGEVSENIFNSPKGTSLVKPQQEECNDSVDRSGRGGVMTKETSLMAETA